MVAACLCGLFVGLNMLDVFTAALAGARTLAAIDDLAKTLWQEFAAGRLSDDQAENLSARLEDRRRELRPQDRTAVRVPDLPRIAASFFPAKNKTPTSPDRAASKARRRQLAFSGPLPPALAARFTVGELAVLRVVGDEFRDKGSCTLPLGAIAARAGVCITLARKAIRLAAGDGLVVIQERRRSKAPNLPNIIRITSMEWRTWINRRRGGGCTKVAATDTKLSTPRNSVDKHPIGDRASRAQHPPCGQSPAARPHSAAS